ncbi:hypothetical protein Q4E93_14010 [Flavitalea sp. BT771]|uniref:hypothetical protein n=1 Tax=Flavitalea sp. BT771 TaxID=3063329 RepID=UPI0026E3D3E1|nr:hypothetical protein [Flavitalea sp. BT771]MDO6431714.1 hypothetical protein [Flavitalea sp. BT771]MDV6220622.1 hypothetical protein [Flavitalea sp. BT771]
MKKSIFPIVLCLTLGTVHAHANNGNFNNEGERSKKSNTVVRNILSDKLPSKLLASIKKEYKDYWITALSKEEASGKISYHITVENADQIISLSATRSSGWAVARIVPKDQGTF